MKFMFQTTNQIIIEDWKYSESPTSLGIVVTST